MITNICRCGWLSVGAYYAANETLQWRLPLALACVGPSMMLICLPFVPGRHERMCLQFGLLTSDIETPRYFSWVGKSDEAWNVIKKLHHDPNDPSDAAARAEFLQITRQVEFDREQKSGYIQMFKKPSWRRRCLLVMFLQYIPL
jgi:hypothetical protein